MLMSCQLRAARAMLGWSARRLAQRAGVHVATIQRMERRNGPVHGHTATVDALTGALEAAGIELFAEDGRVGVALKNDAVGAE